MELVYADICGPISSTTPAGNCYFLLFVDDFSKKMWVYLLKEKSSASEIIKRFKVMVEKRKEWCIKKLRTDRDGADSAQMNLHLSVKRLV